MFFSNLSFYCFFAGLTFKFVFGFFVIFTSVSFSRFTVRRFFSMHLMMIKIHNLDSDNPYKSH